MQVSKKELILLRLLMDNPKGLYGSEIVHVSDGQIGRGSVYTLLERLVDKGFVKEVDEPPTPEFLTPRTRHFITGIGQRAVYDFAQACGLRVVEGALAR